MTTSKAPLESTVEGYLVKRIKALGGEVRKVQWIGRKHAPDRVVFFKGTHWIELKRPGKKPEPGQAREHKRMRDGGASVHWTDTQEGVDAFINWLLTL